MHKLAIWLLLPIMLLNGLWMVCSPPDAADSPAHSQESADCIRICAALEASFGRICFFLPGNNKTSITILDFGAAILPIEFMLQPVVAEEPFVTRLTAAYSDPSLSDRTPPPRA